MGVLVVTVRGARWDASGTAKVTEGNSKAETMRVRKRLIEGGMERLRWVMQRNEHNHLLCLWCDNVLDRSLYPADISIQLIGEGLFV